MMEVDKEDLYYACEKVRIFLVTRPDFPRTKIQIGSEIHYLIKSHKFHQLFNDPQWLTLLEAAGNFNALHNWHISKPLRTICKAYPKAINYIGVIG